MFTFKWDEILVGTEEAKYKEIYEGMIEKRAQQKK